MLALHRTAILRHDEYGQETLLNLLLRNYLHYNLYDQVWHSCRTTPLALLTVSRELLDVSLAVPALQTEVTA